LLLAESKLTAILYCIYDNARVPEARAQPSRKVERRSL
jgi:hypothetical protein